ncbi:MAG: hypothetical protein LBQ22_00475 [Bacteroidales bacterium]|jgi:thioredoxin-related protein|nr:hypothetical protein [Bacteroidales bacterium]
MKIYLNTLIILCFLFGVSCSNNKSNSYIEKENLLSAIKSIKVDSFQWIIVLPGLGCHGCIQEAELFMKEYIENEHILFILTKVESIKILQQKIEVSIKDRKNVYIDKNNVFGIKSENGIYPCIIKLDGGEMKNYSFQSPGNPAFDILKEILKKEKENLVPQ